MRVSLLVHRVEGQRRRALHIGFRMMSLSIHGLETRRSHLEEHGHLEPVFAPVKAEPRHSHLTIHLYVGLSLEVIKQGIHKRSHTVLESDGAFMHLVLQVSQFI